MRFVLVLFILLSISLSAQSQDTVRNLTIGEVFDFQESDIFHFDYEYNPDGWYSEDIETKWNILSRQDSSGKNKVSYRIARKIVKSEYKGSKEDGTLRKVYNTWKDTVFKSYNNLDSSIKTYQDLTELTPRDTQYNTKIDTLYGNVLCDKPFVGVERREERMDGESHTYKFAKGLGRTNLRHFNSESGSVTETTKNLVYFKGKQKTCGEKLWRLTSANLDKKPIQQIFNLAPNPASDQMTIQLPNNGFQQKTIRIYNMKGRKMMEREVTQKNARLNLSPFSPGIYFVQIPINGVIQTKKLQVRP